MQSKFTIMRANHWKMAEAKTRAERRRYNIVVDHWPDISREYPHQPFVWWNPKTWRYLW